MSNFNSNNQPLVTFVTVTYNSSKYVRDAIEGVLAQTYTNIEYIIADDCSTDETWQIIQEYKDPRIKAYQNETNFREYPNRNKAVDLASGEYLLFIDGDDYIYPHSLQILVNYMLDYPSAAFAVMCPENNNFFYPVLLSSKEIFQLEFSEFGIINRALSHTFYKTEILKNNKFKTGEYYSGDTLNRLEIAVNHPCLLVNDNLTWWRVSESQASQKLHKTYRNEQYLMAKNILFKTQNHLNNIDNNRFFKNSKIKFSRQFLSLIYKLNFKGAFSLIKNNNLKIKDLLFFFKSLDLHNPIIEITKSKTKVRIK